MRLRASPCWVGSECARGGPGPATRENAGARVRYNGGMSDDGGAPRTSAAAWRQHLAAVARRMRRRHRWFDHIARAVNRYSRDRVEYHALVVVSRGLFLTIATVMVLLYALSAVTHLLPGTNEIVIPTVSLSDSQDLGAVVDRVLEQFQSAVVGLVGVGTLLISAALTARALRQGTRQVFAPGSARSVGRFAPSNLAIGLGLAAVTLVSWLLALATAVRTAAISEMLGADVSRTLVPVGKAVTVAIAFALITLVTYTGLRASSRDQHPRTVLAGAVAFSAFLTAANFFLLYAYVGALIGHDSAGGVVVVLTVLTWVNAVVRALFLTECWVATASR